MPSRSSGICETLSLPDVLDEEAFQVWRLGDFGSDRVRFEPEYRRLDLQRQALLPDGTWSGWAVVDDRENERILGDVAYTMDLSDQPERVAEVEELTSFVPFVKGLDDRRFFVEPPGAGEPERLMVRGLDTTVEPGGTYRYRARVVIEDPDPGFPGKRELAGRWSDPTAPVTVPRGAEGPG